MIYAKTEAGDRITAYPSADSAFCPQCDARVRPKCGQIVCWHWAHISMVECDPWAERDSAWHLSWQALVPVERREVTIGNHRADLVTADGGVIEIQHSSLSPAEIREREDFYGPKMAWVFDAIQAVDEERLDLRFKPHKDPRYRTFRWKHPRKSIGACRRPVFLDLGEYVGVLRLGRLYPEAPCGGWGFLCTRQELAEAFNAIPS